MTMHDVLAPSESAAIAAPTAVRLFNVSKIYRLYDRPSDRLMDQLGINQLIFWKNSARHYHLFHALKNVDLSIGRGERVGIIGRNGAGKTTLLKLVTGNFAPSEGVVEVNGTVQALMQLGMGFHQEFSGYENIKAALHYNGLNGDEFDAALEDVIDFVELGEFLHQPMKTYSLGMNARVQFATATAIKPDILIIDEVLGAGDAYFAAKSNYRMQKLTGSGCTLLLVSHSWQQVQQFCERVVWLMDGRVRGDGIAHEVLAEYEAYVARETARLQPPQVSIAGLDISVSATKQGTASDSQFDPVSVPLPEYATVAWIAENIRRKEGIAPSDEHIETLANGQQVYRVVGKSGLRFHKVIISSGGPQKKSISTGDPMSVDIEITSQNEGRFSASYWVHLFSIDGRRIARMRSPIDRFVAGANEVRNIRLELENLLVGAGEYLVSISMFDQSHGTSTIDPSLRYDMLARSFKITVKASNDSDPPIVHHPSLWYFGANQRAVLGDINPEV